MKIALATCTRLPELNSDYHPLVRALAKRGIAPIIVPWDASFDWSVPDVCIICSTWDYAPRRAAFIDWARRVGRETTLHNSPELIQWNTHKSYLGDLEQRGVSIIPTQYVPKGNQVDLTRIMREAGWQTVVIKPVVGAGGRETILVTPETVESGIGHLRRTLAAEDMMIQPFLSRVREHGELSLVYIDGQFTHAVRKIAAPGEFRVQDDHGGTVQAVAPPDSAIYMGDRTIAAIGQKTLYSRVDIIFDDQECPRLVELEIVEPELFLRFSDEGAQLFADKIIEKARDNQSARPESHDNR